MKKVYTQGDVCLVQMDKLPKDAKKVDTNGVIILAEGELTGHAHRIFSDTAVLWKTGEDDYIQTKVPEKVVHEEHPAGTFEPGIYKIFHQRTLDWNSEFPQRVLD